MKTKYILTNYLIIFWLSSTGDQPGDFLGCHGNSEGEQHSEEDEDYQTLHQDRPALQRVQELQLHVCHHQVGCVCVGINEMSLPPHCLVEQYFSHPLTPFPRVVV